MALEPAITAYVYDKVWNQSSVAQFIKNICGATFRVVLNPRNSQQFIWQERIDGIYHDMPQAVELHKRIREEIIPYVRAAKMLARQKGNDAKNEIEVDYEMMKYKQLYRLEGELDKLSSRKAVIEECALLYYKK
jgi:hypothetical protein